MKIEQETVANAKNGTKLMRTILDFSRRCKVFRSHVSKPLQFPLFRSVDVLSQLFVSGDSPS